MKILPAVLFAFLVSSTSHAYADPHVVTMVRKTASSFGVPPDLAVKIAQVESGNSCSVIGRLGERGPLQIRPSSAAGLGYRNVKRSSCQVQLNAGMAHLLMCYKAARKNWARTAACHNGGPGVLKKRRVHSAVRQYVRLVMR